jgi:hypothetical protein
MYKKKVAAVSSRRDSTNAMHASKLCSEPHSMPYLVEFDSHAQIIRATVQGELSDSRAEELYETIRTFLSTNEVRGGILDLSPVTSLAVTLNTVRRLAKSPPLFKTPQVRVIVAEGDLIFGMARLFQISRSEIHSELYVVHTLQEAYKIHGLDSPQFVPVSETPRDKQEPEPNS